MTTGDDDSLWTAGDVARYLRVSKSWVYHRAESGELPHLRVGALLRFESDAVRAYARGERRGVVGTKGLPPASIALRRTGSR